MRVGEEGGTAFPTSNHDRGFQRNSKAERPHDPHCVFWAHWGWSHPHASHADTHSAVHCSIVPMAKVWQNPMCPGMDKPVEKQCITAHSGCPLPQRKTTFCHLPQGGRAGRILSKVSWARHTKKILHNLTHTWNLQMLNYEEIQSKTGIPRLSSLALVF